MTNSIATSYIATNYVAANSLVNGGVAFVDFFENRLTGSRRGREDFPVEGKRVVDSPHKLDGVVDQTIVRALRDATQTEDPGLQQEAAAWLLVCCPDIAEQIDLPELYDDAIDTMPVMATAYAGDG